LVLLRSSYRRVGATVSHLSALSFFATLHPPGSVPTTASPAEPPLGSLTFSSCGDQADASRVGQRGTTGRCGSGSEDAKVARSARFVTSAWVDRRFFATVSRPGCKLDPHPGEGFDGLAFHTAFGVRDGSDPRRSVRGVIAPGLLSNWRRPGQRPPESPLAGYDQRVPMSAMSTWRLTRDWPNLMRIGTTP
jgi:hypothetical protein